MTQTIYRGAAVGLLAAGLAACATTPAYPITNDTPPASRPALTPAPAAADTAPAPAVAPPAATPQPAPQPVESQPLAPVAAPAAAPAPLPVAAPNPAPPPSEPTRYIATGKVVEAHGMYRSYKVRRGDDLKLIAHDLETTPTALIEANHLKKPNALRPGQRLKLPVEKVYLVAAGDTVFAVARRFGVDPADLADINVISEEHRLRAGDRLALPSAFHDGGPVAIAEPRYRPSTWSSGPGPGANPPAYPSAMNAPTAALTDAEIASAGRDRFVWPVTGNIISGFGVKDTGERNDGVDLKAPLGAPVHAAAAGDVVYAGDQVPGFGNLVLIKHADGWVTAYAHLDRVIVKMRDAVAQGQEIGQVGQSGGVSEPQLHFEVRYAPSAVDKAKPVDPRLVLPK